MIRHRCSEKIKDALEKGANQLFLHGDAIDDFFLYDYYYGVRTSTDNLKLIFLQQLGYDLFVLVTGTNGGEKLNIYRPDENAGFSEEKDFFKPKEAKTNDALGGILPSADAPKSKDAKELEENVKKNESRITMDHMLEYLKDSPEKTVVYFERFDYYAKLYTQDADLQDASLRRIHEFGKFKNCTVMMSLTNAEKLKPFDIVVKGSNSIYIGNPAADEIKYTYLRTFLRNCSDTGSGNVLADIDEVAQAVASSGKPLRAAIRIFDKIVTSQGKNYIDKAEFESALEKNVPEKVTLDDVIMRGSIKQDIINAIDGFLKAEENTAGRKGIILTGPPGTGKTHIVKAIANEKNCYFFAPTLADLKGEYIGQTSAKVSKVFEEARANSPTILFLDEADTIFPQRDGGSQDTDSYTKDMINQFLVEIDGVMSAKQKIFVIAATNRVNILDSAIKSRLRQIIEVPLPDKTERQQMFDQKLAKDGIVLSKKDFADEIIDKTKGMSGRDIDNFVKQLRESCKSRKLCDMSSSDLRFEFNTVITTFACELINEIKRDSVDVYQPSSNDSAPTYADIIGYEAVKERIDRQINYIKASTEEKLRYEKFGIKAKKGILLYGPPGNGKTQIVKAAAKEHNMLMIKIISKDFSAALQDVQLQRLQYIFESAIKLSQMLTHYSGVILFFDEFDALASTNLLTNVIRGMMLDIIADENGLRASDSRVLFVAATNFKENLDEALIRKGRIDEHICLDNPSADEGIRILIDKFQKDTGVIAPSDADVTACYDELCRKFRDSFIDRKLLNFSFAAIDSNYSYNEDDYRSKLRKFTEKLTPSIAEILNFYEAIKEYSFLKDHSGSKITISPDKDFFSNYEI